MSTNDAHRVSEVALNYLLFALVVLCLMAAGAAIVGLLT